MLKTHRNTAVKAPVPAMATATPPSTKPKKPGLLQQLCGVNTSPAITTNAPQELTKKPPAAPTIEREPTYALIGFKDKTLGVEIPAYFFERYEKATTEMTGIKENPHLKASYQQFDTDGISPISLNQTLSNMLKSRSVFESKFNSSDNYSHLSGYSSSTSKTLTEEDSCHVAVEKIQHLTLTQLQQESTRRVNPTSESPTILNATSKGTLKKVIDTAQDQLRKIGDPQPHMLIDDKARIKQIDNMTTREVIYSLLEETSSDRLALTKKKSVITANNTRLQEKIKLLEDRRKKNTIAYNKCISQHSGGVATGEKLLAAKKELNATTIELRRANNEIYRNNLRIRSFDDYCAELPKFRQLLEGSISKLKDINNGKIEEKTKLYTTSIQWRKPEQEDSTARADIKQTSKQQSDHAVKSIPIRETSVIWIDELQKRLDALHEEDIEIESEEAPVKNPTLGHLELSSKSPMQSLEPKNSDEYLYDMTRSTINEPHLYMESMIENLDAGDTFSTLTVSVKYIKTPVVLFSAVIPEFKNDPSKPPLGKLNDDEYKMPEAESCDVIEYFDTKKSDSRNILIEGVFSKLPPILKTENAKSQHRSYQNGILTVNEILHCQGGVEIELNYMQEKRS